MQNLHTVTPCDAVIRKLCSPTHALPPDVKRLAARCGLALVAEDGPTLSRRCGLHAHYDATADPTTQDRQVAHGVAVHALTKAGADTGDADVQRVIAAIMEWAGVACWFALLG